MKTIAIALLWSAGAVIVVAVALGKAVDEAGIILSTGPGIFGR